MTVGIIVVKLTEINFKRMFFESKILFFRTLGYFNISLELYIQLCKYRIFPFDIQYIFILIDRFLVE